MVIISCLYTTSVRCWRLLCPRRGVLHVKRLSYGRWDVDVCYALGVVFFTWNVYLMVGEMLTSAMHSVWCSSRETFILRSVRCWRLLCPRRGVLHVKRLSYGRWDVDVCYALGVVFFTWNVYLMVGEMLTSAMPSAWCSSCETFILWSVRCWRLLCPRRGVLHVKRLSYGRWDVDVCYALGVVFFTWNVYLTVGVMLTSAMPSAWCSSRETFISRSVRCWRLLCTRCGVLHVKRLSYGQWDVDVCYALGVVFFTWNVYLTVSEMLMSAMHSVWCSSRETFISRSVWCWRLLCPRRGVLHVKRLSHGRCDVDVCYALGVVFFTWNVYLTVSEMLTSAMHSAWCSSCGTFILRSVRCWRLLCPAWAWCSSCETFILRSVRCWRLLCPRRGVLRVKRLSYGRWDVDVCYALGVVFFVWNFYITVGDMLTSAMPSAWCYSCETFILRSVRCWRLICPRRGVLRVKRLSYCRWDVDVCYALGVVFFAWNVYLTVGEMLTSVMLSAWCSSCETFILLSVRCWRLLCSRRGVLRVKRLSYGRWDVDVCYALGVVFFTWNVYLMVGEMLTSAMHSVWCSSRETFILRSVRCWRLLCPRRGVLHVKRLSYGRWDVDVCYALGVVFFTWNVYLMVGEMLTSAMPSAWCSSCETFILWSVRCWRLLCPRRGVLHVKPLSYGRWDVDVCYALGVVFFTWNVYLTVGVMLTSAMPSAWCSSRETFILLSVRCWRLLCSRRGVLVLTSVMPSAWCSSCETFISRSVRCWRLLCTRCGVLHVKRLSYGQWDVDVCYALGVVFFTWNVYLTVSEMLTSAMHSVWCSSRETFISRSVWCWRLLCPRRGVLHVKRLSHGRCDVDVCYALGVVFFTWNVYLTVSEMLTSAMHSAWCSSCGTFILRSVRCWRLLCPAWAWCSSCETFILRSVRCWRLLCPRRGVLRVKRLSYGRWDVDVCYALGVVFFVWNFYLTVGEMLTSAMPSAWCYSCETFILRSVRCWRLICPRRGVLRVKRLSYCRWDVDVCYALGVVFFAWNVYLTVGEMLTSVMLSAWCSSCETFILLSVRCWRLLCSRRGVLRVKRLSYGRWDVDVCYALGVVFFTWNVYLMVGEMLTSAMHSVWCSSRETFILRSVRCWRLLCPRRGVLHVKRLSYGRWDVDVCYALGVVFFTWNVYLMVGEMLTSAMPSAWCSSCETFILWSVRCWRLLCPRRGVLHVKRLSYGRWDVDVCYALGVVFFTWNVYLTVGVMLTSAMPSAWCSSRETFILLSVRCWRLLCSRRGVLMLTSAMPSAWCSSCETFISRSVWCWRLLCPRRGVLHVKRLSYGQWDVDVCYALGVVFFVWNVYLTVGEMLTFAMPCVGVVFFVWNVYLTVGEMLTSVMPSAWCSSCETFILRSVGCWRLLCPRRGVLRVKLLSYGRWDVDVCYALGVVLFMWNVYLTVGEMLTSDMPSAWCSSCETFILLSVRCWRLLCSRRGVLRVKRLSYGRWDVDVCYALGVVFFVWNVYLTVGEMLTSVMLSAWCSSCETFILRSVRCWRLLCPRRGVLHVKRLSYGRWDVDVCYALGVVFFTWNVYLMVGEMLTSAMPSAWCSSCETFILWSVRCWRLLCPRRGVLHVKPLSYGRWDVDVCYALGVVFFTWNVYLTVGVMLTSAMPSAWCSSRETFILLSVRCWRLLCSRRGVLVLTSVMPSAWCSSCETFISRSVRCWRLLCTRCGVLHVKRLSYGQWDVDVCYALGVVFFTWNVYLTVSEMLTSAMHSVWCSSRETFISRSVWCWRLLCPRRGVLHVKRLSHGRCDVDVCYALGVVFFTWNVYLTVSEMLTSAMHSAWCSSCGTFILRSVRCWRLLCPAWAWCSSCETFILRSVRCWRLLCPRRGVLRVKRLSYGRWDVDVCYALGVVFFVWNFYLTVGEMLTSAMPSAWCYSCETFILRSVRCWRLICPRRGVLRVKRLSYCRWDVDVCYALGVVFFAWNVYLTVGEMLTSVMLSAWCSSCETFILLSVRCWRLLCSRRGVLRVKRLSYGRWDVDVCYALGVVFFTWNVYLMVGEMLTSAMHSVWCSSRETFILRSVRCWRLLCPRRGVLHVKRLSYGRWDVDVCYALGVVFFTWNVYLMVGEMLTSAMPSAWCSSCETFILWSVRCWRLLCPRRGVLHVKRLSYGRWDVDVCYALGVVFFTWNVYLTVGVMLTSAMPSAWCSSRETFILLSVRCWRLLCSRRGVLMLTSAMPSAWCSSCETFISRSVWCWRLLCPRRGVLHVKRLSYGQWDVDVCYALGVVFFVWNVYLTVGEMLTFAMPCVGVVFFVWNVYLTVGEMLTSVMPSAWCSSCETFILRSVGCWRLLCPRRGVLRVKLLSYGRWDVDVCYALGVVLFMWNVYLTVGEMLTSDMPSAWCSSCETFILLSVRCWRLLCSRRGVLRVKRLSYGRWDVDVCYALGVVFFVWNVYLTVGEMLTSVMLSAWCSSCETFILRSVRCWRLLCPRRGVLHVKRLSYGRWDVDVCYALGVVFFTWNVYLTVSEMLTSAMPSAWCSSCETFILRSVRCWRLLCPRRGVLHLKRLSYGRWDVDVCYALGVVFFVWNVYLMVGEMLTSAMPSAWCSSCETFILWSVRCWRLLCPRRGVLHVKRLSYGRCDVDVCYALGVVFFTWNVYLTVGEMLTSAMLSAWCSGVDVCYALGVVFFVWNVYLTVGEMLTSAMHSVWCSSRETFILRSVRCWRLLCPRRGVLHVKRLSYGQWDVDVCYALGVVFFTWNVYLTVGVMLTSAMPSAWCSSCETFISRSVWCWRLLCPRRGVLHVKRLSYGQWDVDVCYALGVVFFVWNVYLTVGEMLTFAMPCMGVVFFVWNVYLTVGEMLTSAMHSAWCSSCGAFILRSVRCWRLLCPAWAWCSSCETFILRSVRCWRLLCPRRGVLRVKRLSYGRWDVDVCYALGVVFFVWNVYLTVGEMLTSAMPSAWCYSCETFILRSVRCWRLICPRRGVLRVKRLSYCRWDVDVCYALGVVFFVWNVYLTVGGMLTSVMPSAWCSSCETFILRSVRCWRLLCPRRGVIHVKRLSYGRWDVDVWYALGVVFFVWNVYLTVGEMLTSVMLSAWCSSRETFILRSVRCWRLLCSRRGVLRVKRLSYCRWDVDVCYARGVVFFVWNVYLTVGEMLTSAMPSAWCYSCETFILRSVRCWRLICPRRGVLRVKRLSYCRWYVDVCYALGVVFFAWNIYLTVGEMLTSVMLSAWCSSCETFILLSVRCWRLLCSRRGVLRVKRLSYGRWDVDVCYALGVVFFVWNVYLTVSEMLPAAVDLFIPAGVGAAWRRERDRCDGNRGG